LTKKKKYLKRPFPRKGVDWDKIKREEKKETKKENTE
jgi:hypothetical protein